MLSTRRLTGRLRHEGHQRSGLTGVGNYAHIQKVEGKQHEGNPVYAVQLGEDLWVVHAFQKKSTHGIKTPKHEIDLIKDRLKRLKEILR